MARDTAACAKLSSPVGTYATTAGTAAVVLGLADQAVETNANLESTGAELGLLFADTAAAAAAAVAAAAAANAAAAAAALRPECFVSARSRGCGAREMTMIGLESLIVPACRLLRALSGL